MELIDLVDAVAAAIGSVDARCPAYVTRTGRTYQPGIGPYPENAAMALTLNELASTTGMAAGQFIAYPAAPRQKCDLWFGDPVEWVAEVKMGRFRGDNGKPDDTGIKDLISPFRSDRSALTDAVKLAQSSFPHRKAVLVYGFDDPERPLADAVDALDQLIATRVTVIARAHALLRGLRHPVFAAGGVFGWEIAQPG